MTGSTDPALSDVLFRAARHALTENRVETGLLLADRAVAVCRDPATLINLFHFRAMAGRFDLARAALEEAERCGASEEAVLIARASLNAWDGNILAAIEKLRFALERNSAAAVPVQYALGSLLAASHRFGEANAIFERGLLVECGDGKLTSSRIIRFPDQPPDNRTSIPLKREVEFRSTAVDAQDAEAIYFVSADSKYFDLFAPTVCKALAARAEMRIAVHIHVINPTPEIEEGLAELRQDGALPILVSTESTQLHHLEARARRTYYACARFLILPELLRLYERVILLADIDQLVIKSLRPLIDEFRGHDIGLLRFPLQIANILGLLSATAMIVDATPGGMRFCRALHGNLAERLSCPGGLSWHLDQAALAVAHYTNEDLSTYWMSPSLLDSSSGLVTPPRDDALFWTVTMTLPANIAKLSSSYFLSAAASTGTQSSLQ